MQENLKDILSHLSTDIDQETLLLYLQGKLTPEKQHALEKELMENEFAADALEGLHNFADKKKVEQIVEQLNRDLKKKTARKKAAQEKRRLKIEPWLLITMVILLLLMVLAYFIIYYRLQH